MYKKSNILLFIIIGGLFVRGFLSYGGLLSGGLLSGGFCPGGFCPVPHFLVINVPYFELQWSSDTW
jgi:hypothetical protein